jgi:hypothetical protein
MSNRGFRIYSRRLRIPFWLKNKVVIYKAQVNRIYLPWPVEDPPRALEGCPPKR